MLVEGHMQEDGKAAVVFLYLPLRHLAQPLQGGTLGNF